MMQRRLILSLGLSFTLLWALAAGLMYVDLKQQISETLDQRLAATATLVAGLIARKPELLHAPVDRTLLLAPENEGVACQIRQRDGDIVVRTHGADEDLLGQAEPGFVDRRVEGQRWRLYTLEHEGLLITTADRMDERVALQNGIVVVMVLPFVLALAGSLLVLWWGVRRGLAPLQRLFLALSRRNPASLEPVSVGPLPDELRPVVDTLNELLVRVRAVVRREQRFAGQAAHELRTPLTAVKTHLQVAMQKTPDTSGVALQQAEAGVVRLQRVTEQLLMLARLEDPEQWGAATSAVDDVLSEALADLLGRDRVTVSLRQRGLRIALPATLAAIALRNLLENAVRHTTADTLVKLEVGTGPEREDVIFLIEDEGGKRDVAAARTMHGRRLGLTIVEAIAENFAGSFSLSPRAGGGMRACLRLPLVHSDTVHPD